MTKADAIRFLESLGQTRETVFTGEHCALKTPVTYTPKSSSGQTNKVISGDLPHMETGINFKQMLRFICRLLTSQQVLKVLFFCFFCCCCCLHMPANNLQTTKAQNTYQSWPKLTSAHLCALLAKNPSLSPLLLKERSMCTIPAVGLSVGGRRMNDRRNALRF